MIPIIHINRFENLVYHGAVFPCLSVGGMEAVPGDGERPALGKVEEFLQLHLADRGGLARQNRPR